MPGNTIFALLACWPLAELQAADCAQCHPEETRLHGQSAHATALMRPSGSLFLSRLPGKPLSEGPGGYSFSYGAPPDASHLGVEVTARRGVEGITGTLVWVFGSGRQGQTPVLFDGRSFIEHRVSYYLTTGYGITIGQQNGVSANAKKSLGRVESNADARICFNCHATSVSRDLSRMTPGVQCLRCHAGAEEHAEGHGKPVNPGKLNHTAQVQLCGECHRLTPPSGDEESVGNIRFQPLRLMKSQCFKKGGIACTTCHPAHRNADRDANEVYNRRCLSCHTDRSAHVASQKSDDCIRCHMLRVSPAPGLVFTDHFIRVASL
jgi:hypothetical protein